MADITLREAIFSDLELLRRWDEQPHVKAAIGDDDDDWQWEGELKRSPPWREFLIAELAGRAIGFMQIISPEHIKLRVWERGAGETLACGTGACAAVVVGIPLLAESKQGLQQLSTVVAGLASLLPERARARKVEVDDDF